MFKLIIFITICFGFLACTNPESAKELAIEAKPFPKPDTFSLHLDTLATNISPFFQVCYHQNKEYIGFTNRNLNALELYDAQTGLLAKRLLFSKTSDKISLGDIAGFLVKDFNDIYVFGSRLQKIIHTDSTGAIKSVIKTSEDNLYLLGSFLGMDITPPVWHENKIYFAVPPFSDPLEDKDFFSTKYYLEYDFNPQTAEIKPKNVQYPKQFQGKMWGVMHAFFSRAVNEKGEFIYSFSNDENLYVYDFAKQTQKQFPCKSTKHIDVKPYQKKEDYQKYFDGNSHYERILYDKFKKCYYRFYFYPKPIDDKENLNRKRANVIVLNEKFEKIAEIILPANCYADDAFVGEKGLYVGLAHMADDNEREDELRFLIYDITKMN